MDVNSLGCITRKMAKVIYWVRRVFSHHSGYNGAECNSV